MTMARRILALALTLCLMLPLCMAAGAEGTGVVAGAFKQGAYASEGDSTVYFTVANAGKTSLYSVPSVGGSIELLETQDDIADLVAVGDRVYYLRSVSGSWQLVCRTATELSVLHVFTSGALVNSLGYYDGTLYVVSNDWLYSFDAAGTETLVAEQLLSEYYILGGRIYYVSTSDQRTYQRVDSESKTISATAGCLYSIALDGTDSQQVLEVGVADLRGYGEYLYFHNYSDNYFVASTTDKWLEGRLYRYNIITETNEKAHEDYDWDFYPTGNGLLLYTQGSIDMRNVTENSSVNLMQPEQYTSVAVDGEFALVYEHTTQTMTRVPTNGEISVILGSVLPGTITSEVTEISETGEEETAADATTAPTASTTKAPTTTTVTKKPTSTTTSGYIFPESSTRKLTKADLKSVDPTLWAYGRNEIWARHGYEFNKKIYADYFESKSWYKAGGYSSSDLNSIEWYNMEFIKKYEDMYADEIAALKAGATKAPAASATKAPSDSSYIFPNSSTEKLTKEDILSIDRSLWGYARNEIYARHGYEFKTAKYAKYFGNKTWYKAGGFSTGDLNDIEWYNMDLIKKMEKEY